MDWEMLSFKVCMYEYYKVVQYDDILKSYTMWMFLQSIFSGFIQTM